MAEARSTMLARLKAMRKKFGLGEFKRGKSRPKRATVVRKVKRKRLRGNYSMAKRGRKYSRRSSSMGGTSSLLKTALIGIGTAEFANMVPIALPFKEELVGAAGAYLVGGKNIKSAAVGAGAVYAKKKLLGQSSSSTSSSVTGY
jgi:hypothetical protein